MLPQLLCVQSGHSDLLSHMGQWFSDHLPGQTTLPHCPEFMTLYTFITTIQLHLILSPFSNHMLLGTEHDFLRLTPNLLNIYLFTWLLQGLVALCRIFSGHMGVLVGPEPPTLGAPSLSHWITSKGP